MAEIKIEMKFDDAILDDMTEIKIAFVRRDKEIPSQDEIIDVINESEANLVIEEETPVDVNIYGGAEDMNFVPNVDHLIQP